jgi:WD40 repeat protein
VNVVYDPKTHTQRFFDKHTDDIKTIAFSPDRKYIASGENGKKPVVYVIDSTTLEVKHSFTGHGI